MKINLIKAIVLWCFKDSAWGKMSKNVYIGLDVGGTKVEGAVGLIDEQSSTFTVLSKIRIPLPSHQFENFSMALSEFILKLLDQSGVAKSEIKAIGAGLPGSIDPETNLMINGNTHFLINQNLKQSLQQHLNWEVPLFFENDANLFTLAEAWGGAGKLFSNETKIPFKKQIAIGITLGTGVGGGMVSEGRIFHGARGGAMEVGHISLDPQGRKCYCHQFGCAETYLSGTALQNNRFEWSSSEVFSKYREENINAEKILKDYREKMVLFLRTLSNLFNPHYFVFGGGLSNQADLFIDLKSEMDECLFLGKKYAPEYYINQLGDSAGLYGAMIHAHEKLNRIQIL